MDEEMSSAPRGNTSFRMPVINRQGNVQIRMGNIPRPVATEGDSELISPIPRLESKLISKGRKYTSDNPYYFSHCMLNITNYHPQLWPSVVQYWKSVATQEYGRNNKHTEHTGEDIFSYLGTFLGKSTKAHWDSYKSKYPNEIEELVSYGNNPWNFVNRVGIIITGQDPNIGSTIVQKDALTQLERLAIGHFEYIVDFTNEYYYLTTISGNAFNPVIGDKMLDKLPGALGKEIADRFQKDISQFKGTYIDHIGAE